MPNKNKITLLDSNTKSGLNMDAINENSKVLYIILFIIIVKKINNYINFTQNKMGKMVKITYI